MSIFMNKSIKSAKFLGVRTGEDTGFLATYNYSIYSFFVRYTDGSSETIQLAPDFKAKDKKLFKTLMDLSNESPKEPTPAPSRYETTKVRTSSEIYSDLKSIKELYDSGVLSDDIYEEQKEKLLSELTSSDKSDNSVAPSEDNLFIKRNGSRPVGEAHTIVYIDNVPHKEYDIDRGVGIKLEPGTHTIYFKRAAVKSAPIEITIVSNEVYQIAFSAKVFSIDAACSRQ